MSETYKVTVESDLSDVIQDMDLLESQIDSLNDTLIRLKENGIDIKMTIKTNSKFKNLFKIKR